MNAIEVYLMQVMDKDPQKVINALGHLAAFNDVRALTAIQNAFFHPNPRVRAAAADAAGDNRDESLMDALLSLLDDNDPRVRLAAVNAAAAFSRKSPIEKIILALLERQPEPQTADTVRDIILQAGPGVIPILQVELNSLDKARRDRAIHLLPYLGDLGVMTLISNLPNLNLWESMKSAKMLGGLNHPMLVDYFLDMLSDADVEKRRFAMAAVTNGTFSQKSIKAVGQVLLNDPDQYLRMDAVFYLKLVNHPSILTYLDQYDPAKEKGLYGRWIREFVRDIHIGIDLQSRPLMDILEMLNAGDKHERPLACVEISRREDPLAIPFLANALRNETYFDAQGHILVSLSDLEAVEAVDDILDFFDGSYTNQEDALALRILGELYHPKALEYLELRASKPILNDIPAETEPIYSARNAVETIKMRMGFLRKIWFTEVDTDEEQRVLVAILLAMRGDARGIDLMMAHFSKTDIPAIRYQTLRALGESGSVFVLPFLKDILKSPKERLVWHTLLAIGQLPLENAPYDVSALLLDEKPILRTAALFALGKLKDLQTLPSILNRLKDTDPYVRAVALQSLSKFPFDSAWLPILEPLTADENAWVRLETARLLFRNSTISTREALMRMLRDEKQQIRFFGSKLANSHLDEDLRPTLEYCASIKGGNARRNARTLLKLLDQRKGISEPEAQKHAQEQVQKKRLQALRKGAKSILTRLEAEGWQSLLVTQVAGTAYVDWETLYAPLEPGNFVNLIREPENPFDDLAIMVQDENGQKLGYIPAALNYHLAYRMDEGKEFPTIVLKIDRQSRVHYMTIEVLGKE